MKEPFWKVELFTYWLKEKDWQYKFCQISECGYGTIMCPKGVKGCRECRRHILGSRSYFINKWMV